MREFSPVAVLLGLALSVIFGVSNAYLALKAGMTVSASIPAAVGALAFFSLFYRRGSVLEGNIVQTIASAGESLAAALAFTLPAFFVASLSFHPYHIGFLTLVGGAIGVLSGIAFRDSLVKDESLPFPEGRACAVVLQSRESGKGVGVLLGALLGALLRILQSTGLIASSYFTSVAGKAVALDLSPAVVGAGAIVGLRTALMVAAGGILGWWAFMPFYDGTPLEVWSRYIRFIGAGAVLVGGIYEFLRVILKLLGRMRRGRFWIVLAVAVGLGMGAGVVIPELGPVGGALGGVLGVVFAYVSGNTTAIVGSSSNPISGMTIAALVVVSLLFKALGWGSLVSVLAMASVVASAAAIAGDTVQDLKTGYIVGATPFWQYVGEFLGIAVSFLVLTFVVSLLGEVFGFGSEKLPAPQGVLMGSIAQGIFQGTIDWNLIFIGGAVAVAVAMMGLPVLPIAVGLYLPLHLSGGLLLGALIARLLRREGEHIVPSGVIAGDALTSVIFALGIGFLGWSFPEAAAGTWLLTLLALVLGFAVVWRFISAV
ncbi:MAG: hypothetical protein GXO29_04575 [Thermotogae bacterium]|nr:hypothetical protein [Thermotogota bacterium]